MTFYLQPFLSIFGIVLLSVLPVWGFILHLKVDPLIRLTLAVMGSFTLIYLLIFGAYLTSIPLWIVIIIYAFAIVVSIFKTLIAFKKNRKQIHLLPWDGLLTWTGVSFFILALQIPIVVYGAVSWYGDWYEHYERTLFFLDQQPPDTRFALGAATLPARGPTFNAVASFFLKLFGREFWVYQGVTSVLNSFLVLPLALLLRDFGQLKQSHALLWSAVICAIAPFAVQQETYTWTKFFAIAFFLGGVHLYLIGVQSQHSKRVILSLLIFACGILAHYMVVVYVAFFALHLLFLVFFRKWGMQPMLHGVSMCSAFLATWFIYLIAIFGLRTTLTANSTVGTSFIEWQSGKDNEPIPWSTAFMGNMITTTIPYSFRYHIQGLGHAPWINHFDPRGGFPKTLTKPDHNHVYEWMCSITNNPCSLLGGLGFAGTLGLLLIGGLSIGKKPQIENRSLIDNQNKKQSTLRPGKWFWSLFFVIGIPLNISLSRDYSPHGVAHLNLQPFICLAIVGIFRWRHFFSKGLKWSLSFLFLMESIITTGALLILEVRSVPIELNAEGRFDVTETLFLNTTYINNYMYKLYRGAQFLSDRFGDNVWGLSLVAISAGAGMLLIVGYLPNSVNKSHE